MHVASDDIKDITSAEMELVSECLNDNADAWNRFVDAMTPVIWNVIWHSGGGVQGKSFAEDIYQDVFLKILSHDRAILRRFDASQGSLSGYIATVARSCTIDRLRRTGHLPECSISVEIAAKKESLSSDDVEAWELSGAMASLTERERMVIQLLFRDEKTTAEVADALGISEGTVRSTKCHALENLRRFFNVCPG